MSDDEADPELLALLAESLGLGPKVEGPPKTGVLEAVEYVYDNALDVSISSAGSKAAAALLYERLQQRQYSTYDWAKHELHPKPGGGEATVNFIFAMNLLNFSFWSDLPEDERFAIDYKGKQWTGYWSLVGALQRGLDEELLTGKFYTIGYPITTPSSWSTLTDDNYAHIFRSATHEPMPLLSERINLLRTASHIEPTALIHEAHQSAARLVNLLTTTLPAHFSDTANYSSRTISFHKRAQILVADLWACFRGRSYGEFPDIDTALTMFADYRIPQMLQRLGVLWYSPRLEGKIRRKEVFESGEKLEVEIRGCSVWAVEMLRREIVRRGGGSWEAEVEEDDLNDNDNHNDNGHNDHVGDIEAAITNDTNVPSENSPPPAAAAADEAPAQINNVISHRDADDCKPPEEPSTASANDPENSETTSTPPPPPPTSAAAAAAAAAAVVPHNQSTPPPEVPPSATPTKPKRTKTVKVTLNAVLLDYLLYDTAKELEAREQREAQEQAEKQQQQQKQHGALNPRLFGSNGYRGGGDTFEPDGPKTLPHHRCRSIWY